MTAKKVDNAFASVKCAGPLLTSQFCFPSVSESEEPQSVTTIHP